jgi:hypothetical protein
MLPAVENHSECEFQSVLNNSQSPPFPSPSTLVQGQPAAFRFASGQANAWKSVCHFLISEAEVDLNSI